MIIHLHEYNVAFDVNKREGLTIKVKDNAIMYAVFKQGKY